MKSTTAFDDQWSVEPLPNGDFKVVYPNTQEYTFSISPEFEAHQNSLTMIAGNTEMLRIAQDGFYVRGVKVTQDDKEAEIVYNAFKQFLTWAELNRR
jgi:hypothetical protein